MTGILKNYNTQSGAENFVSTFTDHLNSMQNEGLRYYALSTFMREWKKTAPSWSAAENHEIDNFVLDMVNALPLDYRNELLMLRQEQGLEHAGVSGADRVSQGKPAAESVITAELSVA